MKFLKIDKGRAFYLDCSEKDSWSPVDEISKEHLMCLLNKAIDEDFEMDEYNEEVLQNAAHRIIYKSLYEKFSALLRNKKQFKDLAESRYKAALEKYS